MPLLIFSLLRPLFDDPPGNILGPACQVQRFLCAFLVKDFPWGSVLALIAIVCSNMLFKPQFLGDLTQYSYLPAQAPQSSAP